MLSPSCPLKCLNEKGHGSHLILTKQQMSSELLPGALCGLGAVENDLDQHQGRARPHGSVPGTVLSRPESDSKPFLSGLITPLVTDEDTGAQRS